MASSPPPASKPLAGKVAVVTGANTGIGKETARGLAALGATVVLACRDAQKGEAARADLAASTGNDRVTMIPLDLADLRGSDRSIRGFVSRLRERFDRLDVLVNNAGVNTVRRQVTRDGFEMTFGVNHLGTFALTLALRDLLERSAPSRVVVVSSRLHRRGKLVWDDLQRERRRFSGLGAYNDSKLANVLFANALAERLAGTGVTVNSLHPGLVRTELVRDLPAPVRMLFHLLGRAISPVEGAACSLHVASAPELAGVTGRYFEKSRPVDPAPAALDREAQARLWELSEKWTAN